MSSKIVETFSDGSEMIVLANEQMEVWLNSQGATIVRLFVKDRDGRFQDVVLGHDNHDDYEKYKLYVGAVAGRVCNRIKEGRFELNGNVYQLPVNNGPNSLHGGIKGFSFVNFDADLRDSSVLFTRRSADMEEGYPGNLDVSIEYSIDENTLSIHYQAVSDQDTLVNLTNHTYFNLDGKAGYIGDHELTLAADEFVCVDPDGLATGEIRKTAGTPFDFAKPKKIDLAFDDAYDQVKAGSGIDHHFLFNKNSNQAVLYSDRTGIELTLNTTLPGAQVYSANFLQNEPGKNGDVLPYRGGICLETQKMPDDIHINSSNPETLLRKGDVFDERTSFTFKVR